MTPFPKSQSASAARVSGRGDPTSALSLQRLRDGDPRAFEVLFHSYYEALYNFAYPYVHAREIAEELVQDVFCRLWERRAALPAPTGDNDLDVIRGYLYRSVRNAAVSWLRHQRVARRLSLTTDITPPGMGTTMPRTDAAVYTDEVQTLLQRAVAALPEHYRQVLSLRSEHHLSYPEIAATLGIPLKTVESRMTRAFRALREALDGLR
jgi:RNA polymerase sigma-70 factor (ECF subfamily)